MTTPRHKRAEPGTGLRNATPLVPGLRPPEQDLRELRDPDDLPFPGRWPPGRPEYVIVVDQLRDRQPGQPPSLAELLETRPAREPEPELEPNHDPDPEVIVMTLTINDITMTSDRTAHNARQARGPQRGWEVSWLPGQTLDRNTAITAMILADTAAGQHLHENHRLWPFIHSWAAELGLTGPEAITQAAQPPAAPSRQPGRADAQPDREAAD